MKLFSFRKKTAPVAEPSEPRLLNLPGELRNMIYSFVFADIGDAVTFWINKPKPRKPSRLRSRANRNSDEPTPLSLLLVCRQIRSEAMKHVYDNAAIGFTTGESITWTVRCYFGTRETRMIENFTSELVSQMRTARCMNMIGERGILALLRPTWMENGRMPWFLQRAAKFNNPCPALRAYSSNVAILTWSTDHEPIFTLFNNLIVDDGIMRLLAFFTSPQSEQKVLRVFPNLREVRLQNEAVCVRLKRGVDQKWMFWFSREAPS